MIASNVWMDPKGNHGGPMAHSYNYIDYFIIYRTYLRDFLNKYLTYCNGLIYQMIVHFSTVISSYSLYPQMSNSI